MDTHTGSGERFLSVKHLLKNVYLFRQKVSVVVCRYRAEEEEEVVNKAIKNSTGDFRCAAGLRCEYRPNSTHTHVRACVESV